MIKANLANMLRLSGKQPVLYFSKYCVNYLPWEQGFIMIVPVRITSALRIPELENVLIQNYVETLEQEFHKLKEPRNRVPRKNF